MEVIVRGIKGATVIDLHGRLDFNARWHVKAVMNQCCLTEEEHLIVNLSGISFIDSAALGFLVSSYLQYTGLKRRMTWIQPRGTVSKMVESLQLKEFIPIVSTVKDASLRLDS